MRKLVLALFLVVVSLSFISAAEFTFTKGSDNFNQGETLIASVSGNFVDRVTRNDVFFYEDHVRIPMVYDVGKINDDFYIYAELIGKDEGNYSVRIEGVRYILGTKTTDDDVIMPFTITNRTADFSVSPGFVKTSGDFSLQVRNLKSTGITVSVESSDAFSSESSVELVSGETEEIEFILESTVPFFEVQLNSGETSYSVPVSLEETSTGEESAEQDFKFEPNKAQISIPTDSDSKRIVYLVNTGGTAIEEISFLISSSLDPYINISPSSLSSLSEGSTEKIEIFVFSGEEEAEVEGSIIATSENVSAFLDLSLSFIKDFIPEGGVNGTEDSEIITTCEQLEGAICGENQACSGETISAKDGICCLQPSVCEQVKESNTGRIIGWGIVVVVIILLFWFFKKYKKARPKADILSFRKKKK